MNFGSIHGPHPVSAQGNKPFSRVPLRAFEMNPRLTLRHRELLRIGFRRRRAARNLGS